MIKYRIRLNRLIPAFFLISILLALFSSPAFADLGPKPSVTITFKNLPEGVHYATLLADLESYGPYKTVSEPEMDNGYQLFKVSSAFLDFAARDNFFYWGNIFRIENRSFRWGYYPPQRFKVLIYDVGSDVVYASGEAARYAFDSFFTVTFGKDGTLRISKESFLLQNTYNIVVRLAVTLLMEILTALFFGYRKKKEILLILLANIITQAFLNGLLAATDRYSDRVTWLFLFPLAELVIFAGEAAVYAKCLKSHSKTRAVLYAIVVNTASLFSGALIGGILM